MRAVLLDTHTLAWGLVQSSRLSRKGRASIEAAATVWISPISFYEIAQKVRLGKWPQMEPYSDDLLQLSDAQGAKIAPAKSEIFLQAGAMEWKHRDPFDRILAATALQYAVPIVSADTVFDGVVSRVW